MSGLSFRTKARAKFHTLLTGVGGVCQPVTTALVAAGTTIADALALVYVFNVIATAAAGTGVILPPAFTVGQECFIYNDGANAIKVYAGNTGTIDGTAGATGVALTNALRCRYVVVALSAVGVPTWKSDKLGAVSS